MWILIQLVAAILLATSLAACEASRPPNGADQVIHVVNHSDRAVMVTTGSLLDQARRSTAAKPCGGEVTLAIEPSDYEEDGRLIAFLAIGEGGNLDIAVRDFPGDPIDIAGDFIVLPIWSDGTLASRLPLNLTVAPDLTVSDSAEPGASPSADCTPAY